MISIPCWPEVECSIICPVTPIKRPINNNQQLLVHSVTPFFALLISISITEKRNSKSHNIHGATRLGSNKWTIEQRNINLISNLHKFTQLPFGIIINLFVLIDGTLLPLLFHSGIDHRYLLHLWYIASPYIVNQVNVDQFDSRVIDDK